MCHSTKKDDDTLAQKISITHPRNQLKINTYMAMGGQKHSIKRVADSTQAALTEGLLQHEITSCGCSWLRFPFDKPTSNFTGNWSSA